MEKEREVERDKYLWAYKNQPNYRMSGARLEDARAIITNTIEKHDIQTFLDVGCGRGELLNIAESLGAQVQGTEIVPALIGDRVIQGWAHDLPFDNNEFDFVSCCDVVEHLIPDDTAIVLDELRRVARKAVYVTANNKDSFNLAGHDLHINKRSYDEWDVMIRRSFEGWVVTWLSSSYVSEGWLCENRDIL